MVNEILFLCVSIFYTIYSIIRFKNFSHLRRNLLQNYLIYSILFLFLFLFLKFYSHIKGFDLYSVPIFYIMINISFYLSFYLIDTNIFCKKYLSGLYIVCISTIINLICLLTFLFVDLSRLYYFLGLSIIVFYLLFLGLIFYEFFSIFKFVDKNTDKVKIYELLIVILTLFLSEAFFCTYFIFFEFESVKYIILHLMLLLQIALTIRITRGQSKFLFNIRKGSLVTSLPPLKTKLNEYGESNLKEQFELLFVKDKIYLSPNLQLDDVAAKLFTNKTYVSRLVNNVINKNFRDYVNYYRISEALSYLIKDPSLDFYVLSEKCGFKNYTSFCTAFKVNTGCTPLEWRKKYNQ